MSRAARCARWLGSLRVRSARCSPSSLSPRLQRWSTRRQRPRNGCMKLSSTATACRFTNGPVRSGASRAAVTTGPSASGFFVEPIWNLDAEQIVLDGEVIVPAQDGLSDFGALESDLAKGGSDRLVFYAFDLLHLDGFDLRRCRLLDRKRALAQLIGGATGALRYSEHLEGDGPSIFRQACDLKLEGVVSKRVDGRYVSGRTSFWTKITCRKRDTFVVAGIAYKAGKFDGVYLGRREDGGLVYAGKVERGFSEDQKREIANLAKRLKSRSATLKVKKPKALWLKPEVLADVEYRALTGDGKLRHPSFKGIRNDL